MKVLRNAWNMVTTTFSVVRRNGNSRLYPLLAYASMLLVTYVAIIPIIEAVLQSTHQTVLAQLSFFLVVYLAYGVLYFVVAFCNVALVTAIAARLDRNPWGLTVGFARASQRVGLIARYTLVSATLGLLGFLARTLINPLFGMFIAPAIGKRLWTRWQHLSYTVPLLMEVPVIALDQPAPNDAFKRSDQMVKETWGERVQPAHSIGILALLVMLPIIIFVATPLLQQGRTEHNADLFRVGLSVMLIAISTYTQLHAVVQAIFALAAYRYATTRNSDVVPGDASYAEHAFVTSDKKATDNTAITTASRSL